MAYNTTTNFNLKPKEKEKRKEEKRSIANIEINVQQVFFLKEMATYFARNYTISRGK